jgi:GABA(A) receptor-associated protein
MNKNSFKMNHSIKKRKEESTRLLNKYPDRIPVICEKFEYTKSIILPSKILIPHTMTIAQVNSIIRSKNNLTNDKSIFLFIKQDIICPMCVMEEVYHHYKDDDGFLYIQYTSENTFGNGDYTFTYPH